MAKVLSRTLPSRPEFGLGGVSALVALSFMALVLSGCNTFEGMGKDVSAAGSAVSNTAEDVKEEM